MPKIEQLRTYSSYSPLLNKNPDNKNLSPFFLLKPSDTNQRIYLPSFSNQSQSTKSQKCNRRRLRNGTPLDIWGVGVVCGVTQQGRKISYRWCCGLEREIQVKVAKNQAGIVERPG